MFQQTLSVLVFYAKGKHRACAIISASYCTLCLSSFDLSSSEREREAAREGTNEALTAFAASGSS